MDRNLKDCVAKISDFPKPGVMFYDISPILADSSLWKKTISLVVDEVTKMKPDILVGIESRGFLVAAPVAIAMNLGFTMVRKQGKLPGDVLSYSYNLEYGSDIMEIKQGIIKPKQRVVILDDLLATGGTINATCKLLANIGAEVVGSVCIIELLNLHGRDNTNIPIKTIMQF